MKRNTLMITLGLFILVILIGLLFYLQNITGNISTEKSYTINIRNCAAIGNDKIMVINELGVILAPTKINTNSFLTPNLIMNELPVLSVSVYGMSNFRPQETYTFADRTNDVDYFIKNQASSKAKNIIEQALKGSIPDSLIDIKWANNETEFIIYKKLSSASDSTKKIWRSMADLKMHINSRIETNFISSGENIYIYYFCGDPAVVRDANKDDDGDGIMNAHDECPQDSGTIENEGCPDTDGDGFHDRIDNRKYEPGQCDEGCPCPDCPGDTD